MNMRQFTGFVFWISWCGVPLSRICLHLAIVCSVGLTDCLRMKYSKCLNTTRENGTGVTNKQQNTSGWLIVCVCQFFVVVYIHVVNVIFSLW